MTEIKAGVVDVYALMREGNEWRVLALQRADFYEKELTFQVSCSYGPGRYDEAYEQGGHDYPLPYVRWTEQRNFMAVLNAMAEGRLDVKPLITHRFPLAKASEAYQALSSDAAALGILLEYGPASDRSRTVALASAAPTAAPAGEPVVALLGAGGFARAVLLPALARAGARLAWVGARSNTAAATDAARRHGVARVTSDYRQAIEDPSVNTIFIATRHDSHARLVLDGLAAGKHVFVEKPLCLTEEELDGIGRQVRSLPAGRCPLLMVGFNRRFSPHVVEIRRRLAGRTLPLCMSMTVNAGEVAAFLAAVRGGGPSPIPFDEIVNVTRASFAAVDSARAGQAVPVPSV